MLPRRDAASNLQAAVSLAATGERVVPVDPSVIGGPRSLEDGRRHVASAAFYQSGRPTTPAVQPQFSWRPSSTATACGPAAPLAQLLPAVVMALVLLVLGLFAGHLAGPWWGVAAAGLTAVLFPVLNVARGTYPSSWLCSPSSAGCSP